MIARLHCRSCDAVLQQHGAWWRCPWARAGDDCGWPKGQVRGLSTHYGRPPGAER